MEPIDDIETAYHSFKDMINYIPVSSLTDLQSQAKYLDIIRDIVYRVIRKNVPYSKARVDMGYRYFISDHNINLFTGDTSVSLGVDYIVTVHCDDTFCNSDHSPFKISEKDLKIIVGPFYKLKATHN